jgi:hypothetical protein
VQLPEVLFPLRSDELVKLVNTSVSNSEGRVLSHHNEKNNSERKHVDTFAVISLFFVDFWSHVEGGSQVGPLHPASVVSFKWRSESEIGNFDVVVGTEENVLRLEISVSDSSLVNVVNTFNHLTEKEPG